MEQERGFIVICLSFLDDQLWKKEGTEYIDEIKIKNWLVLWTVNNYKYSYFLFAVLFIGSWWTCPL